MYLILIGMVSVLPIPVGGLTQEAVESLISVPSDIGFGNEPHQIFAVGSIYFFLMGVFESNPRLVVAILWHEKNRAMAPLTGEQINNHRNGSPGSKSQKSDVR